MSDEAEVVPFSSSHAILSPTVSTQSSWPI